MRQIEKQERLRRLVILLAGLDDMELLDLTRKLRERRKPTKPEQCRSRRMGQEQYLRVCSQLLLVTHARMPLQTKATSELGSHTFSSIH